MQNLKLEKEILKNACTECIYGECNRSTTVLSEAEVLVLKY